MAGNLLGNVVCATRVIVIALLLCISDGSSQDDAPERYLITEFLCETETPCTGDCTSGIAYIKSKGDTDTLHYIVSCMGGPPTVTVIRTDTPTHGDGKVDIDCTMIATKNHSADAIVVKSPYKVLYKYSVVFTRVFQYNDTSDKADPDHYNPWNTTAWRVYDFTDFIWQDMKSISSNSNIKLKVLQSKSIGGVKIVNGSLGFQFYFTGTEGRSTQLPHLMNNENSVQIDFTLQNIDAFVSARWVLEAVVMSSDGPHLMTIDKSKSIDDEYTPGVFTIFNWLTHKGSDNSAYLQWKPVCYIDTPRSRATATKVNHKSLIDVQYLQKYLDFSTASFLSGFKSKMANNFTFGLEKDDAFTKNFTSWTVNLGYGTPPKDKVSTLVIGVISAGLGIPVVLIIFGGICVIIKKRTSKDNYEIIKDTDSNHSIQ